MNTPLQGIKDRIEVIVRKYVKDNPQEFALFLTYMNDKRGNLVNDFAELKQTDMLLRQIYEIPATLQESITKELSYDDEKWLQTKEGSIWFAKHFPVFSAGNKV